MVNDPHSRVSMDEARPDGGKGVPDSNGPAAGKRGGLGANLVLATASILFTLLAMEIALRIRQGGLFDFSSRLDALPNRSATPAADYDAELGWVPRPGVRRVSETEVWTISPASLRLAGNAVDSTARPVVVVGDSFTFGDEVMDPETWPARLEARLGVRVLNAGVFAYGVDQAYLRARRLIEEQDPAIVLLAFISDDINRSENSYYSGWKPYFALEAGELVLHNVPVPENVRPEPGFATLRDALSRSVVLSALLRRVARRWWGYGTTVHVHGDGERVAVELFRRLDELARSRGTRFGVIALATRGRMGGNGRTPQVVEETRRQGVAVLDLVPEIESIPDDSVGLLFRQRGHFSPAMNDRVAGRIADWLEEGH